MSANLDDIVSLAKRRGFVYQGSEIYGGLAGVYDYGPLGVALKRNLQQQWWSKFVVEPPEVYGLDAAILMNPKVWEASGHVAGFTDPLIECANCTSRYRTDQIIADDSDYQNSLKQHYKQARKNLEEFPDNRDQYTDKEFSLLSDMFGYARVPAVHSENATSQYSHYLERQEELAKKYLGSFAHIYLTQRKFKCPNCSHLDWGDSTSFNMMFSTTVGTQSTSVQFEGYNSISAEITAYANDKTTKVVQPKISAVDSVKFYAKDNLTYLRPETAQGIFVNYKNVLDSFSPDMPFGIGQIGKAFRNEISPRDWLFRQREFEQMELQYFIHPDMQAEQYEKWRGYAWNFLTKVLQIDESNLRWHEHAKDERAHYAAAAHDIEFNFPFGFKELWGTHSRTDYDLKAHQKLSGKNLLYQPKDGGEAFVPHVIESSVGLDRMFLAVLTQAYTQDEVNGEKRVYLKLPASLAPVKVAVSPLLKNKPELVKKAREVYKKLASEVDGAVMWDDNGNIGKRYRRQDEIGTPYCITVDFQTLEDNTVTVRNRDTTEQQRIKIEGSLQMLKFM